eukprot:57584_1
MAQTETTATETTATETTATDNTANDDNAQDDNTNVEEKKEEKKEEQQQNDDDNNKKKESTEGSWLALESNPGPLNKFARRMGLPDAYAFCDIWGLDDDLLAFVPQPVLAVMFLFPSSKGIKEYKLKQQEEYTQTPQKLNNDLFYLYQHDDIGNACGTIAMIHALTNNHGTGFTLKQSALTRFMESTSKMDWTERGWALLKAKDIQEVSEETASNKDDNQTKAPSKNDKVNAHFIAFIRKNDELYELDGRKKFPINHGKTSQQTFLKNVAKVVKDKFMKQDANNVNFNLMALAPKQEW